MFVYIYMAFFRSEKRFVSKLENKVMIAITAFNIKLVAN